MLHIWCAKTCPEHNALKSVSGRNYLAAYYFTSLDSQKFFAKQLYISMILNTEKGEQQKKEFSCEFCDFTTQRKYNLNKHLLSSKHNQQFSTEKGGVITDNQPQLIFHCAKCNYNTLYKDKWNKHVLTTKHKRGSKGGVISKENICKYCNNEYSSLHGLMVHQNKCTVRTPEMAIVEQNAELMRKNQELTDKIIDICTNMKPSSITNNNTTNQAFNLNFFLNDTCKNAMTLQDFVNSIQLELTDLEETGRLGFSGGISNIIINSLNKMETGDRPMHNTDVKREIIYVKMDTEWKKDDNKEQLTAAIKQIANKNIQNILPWRELHPECSNSSSRKNDQYLKIVGNAMSGGDRDEIKRNIDKVISNIAKKITVDK